MLFTVAEIADFLYNVLFTVSCNYYSRRNSLSTFKKSLAVGSSDYNDQFVFNAWLPCPHFLSLLMCNNSSGDRKWVKATVWSIEQSDSVSTLTFMTYTDLWLWYPQWQVKWCHPAYSIDAKNGWPWISQLGWCRALQRCIETAIWTFNLLVPLKSTIWKKKSRNVFLLNLNFFSNWTLKTDRHGHLGWHRGEQIIRKFWFWSELIL